MKVKQRIMDMEMGDVRHSRLNPYYIDHSSLFLDDEGEVWINLDAPVYNFWTRSSWDALTIDIPVTLIKLPLDHGFDVVVHGEHRILRADPNKHRCTKPKTFTNNQPWPTNKETFGTWAFGITLSILVVFAIYIMSQVMAP